MESATTKADINLNNSTIFFEKKLKLFNAEKNFMGFPTRKFPKKKKI